MGFQLEKNINKQKIRDDFKSNNENKKKLYSSGKYRNT